MYVHDKYTRALGCSGIEGGPAPDPVPHLDNDMHTENNFNSYSCSFFSYSYLCWSTATKTRS